MNACTSKLSLLGATAVAAGALFVSSNFAARTVGAAPFFVTPTCNDIFVSAPGVQICINVVAKDAEGDAILFLWNGVPFVNAFTNPPAPFLTAPGQDAVTQFCWTPTNADVGQTYMAVFTAFEGAIGTPDSKCDIFLKAETALSAELSSFTGGVDIIGGPVFINFETLSEVDNAYFNVYRSQSTFANATLVNTAPIPALGTPILGASYKVRDGKASNNTVYKYWLEAVDLFGETQLFGPIQVVVR